MTVNRQQSSVNSHQSTVISQQCLYILDAHQPIASSNYFCS
ncbi:hypothetical protein [Nostoc sphaeroides]|nr:hypothetical protein [Nostoc sphaeroides]